MSSEIKKVLERSGIFVGIGLATLIPGGKARLASYAQRQEEILRVMMVLPGKHRYRYEQVDAAINAAGVHPETLYMSLCANEHTIALERFYEALNGPGGQNNTAPVKERYG